MLPVVWLTQARSDVRRIVAYIAEQNPKAAQKIRNALVTSTEYAASHPYMYRRSQRILGTREISIHPYPYRVLYRVTEKQLEVVAVVHVRQQFPHDD